MAEIGSITYRMDVKDDMTPKLETIAKSCQNLEKVIADVGNKTKGSMKDVDTSINKIDQSLNKNNAETIATLKQLQDVMVAVAMKIDKTNEGIYKMGEARAGVNQLKDSINNVGMSMDSVSSSTVSVKQQLREATMQMMQMKLAGQDNSEMYAELSKRVGDLKDAMMDVSAEATNMASDTAQLDTALGFVNTAAGGFGALTAGMELFGKSSEKVAEAEKKLQAITALTTSLQTIQNNLQKQSALMLGVKKVQMLALNKAQEIQLAITNKQVASTKAATLAQKAFNMVANANPYMLLATGIGTVVAALMAFNSKTDDATEAVNTFNSSANEMQEKLNAIKKSSNEVQFQIDLSKANGSDDPVGDAEKVLNNLKEQKKQIEAIWKGASDRQNENKKLLERSKDTGDEFGVNLYTEKVAQGYKDIDEAKKAFDEITEEIRKGEQTLQIVTAETNRKSIDNAKKSSEDSLKEKKKYMADRLSAQRQLIENNKIIAKELKQSEVELSQANIDGMKDGLDKTLAQIEFNKKKELDAINDYADEKKEAEKRNKWLQFASTKEGSSYLKSHPEDNGGEQWIANNTSNIELTLDERRTINNKTLLAQQKADQEKVKAIESALNEYKTLEQKLADIDDKYNQIIKNTNDSGVIGNLVREREKERAELTEQSMKDDASLSKAWGDLTEVSTNQLSALRSYFIALKESKEEAMDYSSMDMFQSKINEITEALNDKKTFSFSAEIKNLTEARKRYKESCDALKKAQLNAKNDAEGLKKAMNKNDEAAYDLNKAYDKAKKKLSDYGQVCGQVSDILNDVGSQMDNVGGKAIQIIGQVLGVVSTACTAMATVSTTAAEEIKTVEKASVILAIISAALQAVQAIASLLKDDSAFETYQKLAHEYEQLKDAIDDVVEAQQELMETLGGNEAEQAYEKAKSLVEREIALAKSTGEASLNSRKSGHHSTGYQIYRDMTDAGWQSLQNYNQELYDKLYNNGKNNTLEGLFDITAQQAKEIKTEALEFYARLNGSVKQYIDDLADYADELADLDDEMKENLADMSFESMSDDFLEALQEMDAGAEEFSEDFEGYMRNAFVKQAYLQNLQGDLNKWYEQFTKDMADDYTLDGDEVAQLRNSYNDIIEKANTIAEQADSIFGNTTSQSALSGAISSASQESIDLLAGQCNAIRTQQVESVNIMREQLVNLVEINAQAVQSNTYLQGIYSQLGKTDTALRAKGII